MRVEHFLDVGWFEHDIINIFMEEFLWVEVKIIMFFSLPKKLGFHPVLPFAQVLTHFEVLWSQDVEGFNISLEMIFQHVCYIYLLSVILINIIPLND